VAAERPVHENIRGIVPHLGNLSQSRGRTPVHVHAVRRGDPGM